MDFLIEISNENKMAKTILARDRIKDIGWFIQMNKYFYKKLS